jgi:hypothetical protein
VDHAARACVSRGQVCKELPVPPQWDVHGVYVLEQDEATGKIKIEHRLHGELKFEADDISDYVFGEAVVERNYSEALAQLVQPGKLDVLKVARYVSWPKKVDAPTWERTPPTKRARSSPQSSSGSSG